MKNLLVFIFLIYMNAYSQEFVGVSNDFEFIGMDSNLIYRCNNYKSEYYNNLFKIKDFYSNNGVLCKLEVQPTKRQIYFSSDISIFNYDGKIEMQFKNNENTIDYAKMDKRISHDHNNLYCSFLVQNNYFLSKIDLDEISKFEVEILPLLGSNSILIEDFIYFSSTHICSWYSSEPEDVYRVRIGDWNSPELVLTNVVSGSWFVIPESSVIYARIKLQEKGKGILWNIDTKSYAIIDELYCKRVIKYDGKYYYEIRPSNEPISYKPVELPKEYPHKDVRILCDDKDRIIVNISNKEKPFTNTFITEELLYNSTNQDLSELSKEELRILRNAFFARQGYTFKSKDLQDFFGQFEWYHKMVERNKYLEISNEDVVISPLDKERVELITKIENNK